MNTLGQLYQKDITRYLEGVIKADDLSHVSLEVEEYVLTDEITQKLNDFFEAYNKKEGNNGVWLAGFFGSGKSHLLKMLSYLLENRTLEDGRKVGDIFVNKIKDNALLKGEILKALRTPAKSILFNIDQKTEDNTKKANNPILSVFVKVFNEMQGYYPSIGYIADFERDLDNNGLFDDFKREFQAISGKSWDMGREEHLLESHHIGEAIHRVKGIPLDQANELIFRYEESTSISPESFANRVAEWVDSQGEGYRINFLVDEIGQYISNQTKLMLNLQTITETLATKCKGRAWVIVTSQQDIDAVVGVLDNRQNNDFSRIQDRFQVKLNLTSKDVDEVIMKRLFTKKEEAVPVLEALYQKEHNNLKTLVQIEGRTFQDYRDEQHFVAAYPALPYQFALLKLANESLANNFAFLGRHRSVGERSLMDVFKTCGVITREKGLRHFIPFDMAFEGLRPTLKSSMQSAINFAENNLNDAFAVRVLKALFLIKYVKEFPANARNIGILLLESLDVDLPEHQRKVQEALNRLEREIYIQRNEDKYAFLTNEEKDIEAEIKNMPLDASAVTEYLKTLVFDHVMKDAKIRYQDNGEDYAIGRIFDGSPLGRDHELSIHIVSPQYDRYAFREALIADNMGRNQLLMILPEDGRLESDARLYLQTDRYIRHNRGTQDDASRQAIIAAKGTANNQRQTAILTKLEELTGKATAYVNGQEVDLPPDSQPRTRILQACQHLVLQTYTNLRMIKGSYNEKDVTNLLILPTEKDLFGGIAGLSEAEDELLNWINRNRTNGQRTTAATLVAEFRKKPYGWPEIAILTVFAKLYRRNKIEVRLEGQEINGQALAEKLNSRFYDKLRIEPVATVDDRSVKNLRDFHREMFDVSNPHNEAKAAAQETQQAFTQLVTELVKLLNVKHTYAFLAPLEPVREAANTVSRYDWSRVYTDLLADEEEWIAWKEDLIGPIQSFMNGPYLKIYDEVRDFLSRGEANLGYLSGPEIEHLRHVRDHAEPYQGQLIQTAKSALDSLQRQLQEAIQTERDKAIQEIDALIQRFREDPDTASITTEQANQLLEPLLGLRSEVMVGKFISTIRERLTHAQEVVYRTLLQRLIDLTQPVVNEPPVAPIDTSEAGRPPQPKPAPAVSVKMARQIAVDYPHNRLSSPEEVEAYLQQLRQAYLKVIHNGDCIGL